MKNNLIFIIILVLNCFLSAVSQVMLKKAATKEYKSFISQYLNFYVISAYFLFFLVVAVNIYIMKYVPLVIMTPVSESLPFIFSIFFGFVFFKEKLTPRKISGALIILAGIISIVM